MTIEIELAQKLDQAAVEQLMATLKSNAGQPVHLNASDTKGMGGLAAQVMLAASRKWRRDGVSFETSFSEAVEADLSRLGLLIEFQPEEQSA